MMGITDTNMSDYRDSRNKASFHAEQATERYMTDKERARHLELARIWADIYASDVKMETTLV